jgi:hypothetical protein
MSTAFITNVGNRDVYIEEHPNLPTDSRTLGNVILKDWDDLRPHLRLPILIKALDWALHRHDGVLDHIVLFASDQPESSRYHSSDTLPFAQVVERYIREVYGDEIANRVEIVIIDGNPADYDAMMRFYAQSLLALQQYQTVYLQVSGGTPAMSFMLLWQGVEKLREAAQPLYVIQEHKTPLSLNIGQTLLVWALVDDLMDSARLYQYQAASSLLRKNAELLSRQIRHYKGVVQLAEHAAHRMNFRFDLAEKALMGVDRHLPAEHRTFALSIMDEMSERDGMWLLREEVFAAEIDHSNGALREMIGHVFAFLEELLYQYALKMDAGILPDGKIDMGWLDSEPELKAYLVDEKNVRLDRGANTFVLDLILAFYAKRDPALKQKRKAISKMIEALRPIRNRMTHDHGGVSDADVEKAYGAALSDLLAELRQMYADIAGRELGPNPFDRVNQIIKTLTDPTT